MKSFAIGFIALCVMGLVAADPFNCTNIVVDDKHGKAWQYDLTSLYHDNTFSDSLYFQSSNGDLTYFNLCGVTTTTCSPSSPVCKRSGLWSTMGYGDLHTQQMVVIEKEDVDSGKGVTVHYTNGEYCPGTAGSSSTIHVVCGTDEVVTELSLSRDGCSITATIVSQAGCGFAAPYSGGSGETAAIVILVLLLVGVILYIAIGMFVNWKFKGAENVVDMIPQREFWMSVPGLVVDGCKFIGHGFKKGDYVSI